jgi:hypothetical protein
MMFELAEDADVAIDMSDEAEEIASSSEILTELGRAHAQPFISVAAQKRPE